MEKITISTGHPDAGRVYAEAYEAALAREAALREELAKFKAGCVYLSSQVRELEHKMDYYKGEGMRADDLQQRLTVAEQRESEAREELLDLSRKLDVFYSRSHGIKNLSAIEDANDKSKALQQRLTVAEQALSQVEGACDLAMSAIDADDRGANFVNIIQTIKDKAALKPAAEGGGS